MGPLEQPFNPSQVALTSVGEPNGSPAVKPKMSLDQGISLGSAVWQPIKDIINFYQTKKENERNRAFAEQQATTAYERQKELWQMEKQYESPAAQMQRYLQAGLNPNLIYGNVSAPGSPAAAPMGNAANQSAPQLQGDPFGSYLQSELVQAQIERLNTQNSNDSALTEAKIKELYGDTEPSKANVAYLMASATSARSDAKYTMRRLDLLAQEIDLKKLEVMFSQESYTLRMRDLQATLKVNEETAERIERTLEASIQEMLANATNNVASAKWLDYQRTDLGPKDLAVKDALISYYNSLGSKADADAAYVTLQRRLEEAYGEDIRANEVMNGSQKILSQNVGGVQHDELKSYESTRERIKKNHPLPKE